MILCDVGNTSVDLFYAGKRTKLSVDDFDPATLYDTVYFVSVNSAFNERVQNYTNWHNLRELIDWDKYYPTMGIDRIMVCEAVEEGVIVDAGSAITVDVMRGGVYQGGFISLGLRAAQSAYANLSGALDVSFNFEVDLAKMAKNTPDALTVGFLAPLIEKIESLGKPLYLTGGDGLLLSRYLSGAVVDEDLIFRGMEKLLQKGSKC
ncbi:putative transcriptional acitvator, Baf family [Sulfuricurvum kujiense DSM 16994]|uniref:Type III pantothenate kinase n=1 Tax=Sulfuricurvum kujiense (strain ATCC BAA-921 / DSM 16994 / JCM 11577 / YK-1) TaxID=709032 RepID=E4TWZ9_SULKY|nr:type III pantothenate kinase [Sulfuricurvum kujiense]ADR33840.1 putative transcriptional acitvator, Baf family [Sulfuricurvum kujiense DSM 16994]